MKKTFLKHVLFPIALLVTFGLSLLFLFAYHKDSRYFTELTAELFKSELIPNTLSMHYTLANPSDYGIYSYDAALPVFSPQQQLEGNARLENILYALGSIRPEKLDEDDAYTLHLLQSYLANEKTGAEFVYYEEPLSPSSGMQSQLPILLAEYTFRSKRDIVDYLALLEQSGDYFAGLLLYEQQKAEAGLFMPDFSAAKVRSQCAAILDKASLEAGEHFLQTTFSQRLQQLVDQGKLKEKEKTHYEEINDILLTTVMLPAYRRLSDSLALLEGQGCNEQGLAHYPKGKAYYEYLLRNSTGCYDSVDEIKGLLYPVFDDELHTLQTLLGDNPELVFNLNAASDPSLFPLTDPEQMLIDLQDRMSIDFPALPLGRGSSTVGCTVKAVSESLEEYTAPAFYLTPPLDDIRNNVIYINEQSSPAGLELYTTLAHEGYPGHLYQSVYSNLFMQKQDTNPVRQLLWYGGYLEGWALYTEFIAYDYAAFLMDEAGYPQSAETYVLEKHNRSMQLCLYSILDIAIHYDGASCEQVSSVLKSFGFSDEAALRSVYEYIVEEPANYLKYYLGYLKILELKEEARTLWGKDYSDLRFHQFFLECGPSDFPSLKERLQLTSVPEAQKKQPAA